MTKDCSECPRFDVFHTSRACHDCKPWKSSKKKDMTREEAIETLGHVVPFATQNGEKIAEAIDMAIEALSDRPIGLKLFEKIIVSHNTKGKPYYDIQYFDTEDRTHHIGYGSYDIQIIAKYLTTYFSEGRPTGEWIDSRYTDTPWNDGFKCSACNRNSLIRHNFCPNCGADMRGDAE